MMIINEVLTSAWDFITNIWVLILFFLIIIPALQRYFINGARKRILRKISRERKSQVITLIHRQETIAFLGIPISRYIDIDDSEEVLRAIRMTPPDTPIDLIMHTPGGIALAATQIAMALKAHPSKKTVIVPHYAMSGGTLIALAADEILMDPHAVLGPVDPQLSDGMAAYPASSVIQVLGKKPVERINDRTLILADEAKKAQAQMVSLVTDILKGKCGEGHISQIIEELVSGKYTHDNPIFPEKARELLGDCVKIGIPESVYELMDFYKAEMGARKPGVEYIPVAPPERGQRR
ncbi:MAG: ATP-dependent Clp protease proteolytic subunit [Methanocella conradii]|nr:ATP-dependent Clp protease proteolytic subunit [Methanocella conradii]MDI6897040.1 ATP-dependent Clp protease proteolytic subunit [Methanocella conradii]